VRSSLLLSIVAFLAATQPTIAEPQCSMKPGFHHIDKENSKTIIYTADAGVASLLFRSNMDVNTDGAARSYHPDDPAGKKGVALNNMGNALTGVVRRKDGQVTDLMCEPKKGACFAQIIAGFEAARDANYNPQAEVIVRTGSIIPWAVQPGQDWAVPCRIQSGPFKGYFVSQTALSVDPSRDKCDQARYLDALAFNAIVLPGNIAWASQGTITDQGDLVVAHDRSTNVTAFAIVGDSGPALGIGEGSVRLAATLGQQNLSGSESYEDVKKLVRSSVQYLLFPKHDIRKVVGQSYGQADIDRVGREIYEQWGGDARMRACSQLPK
jgi:hypothetical protein